MSGAGLNAILFLINSVFDFYLVVLFIRLLLVWVHADYFQPMTQFIVKLTDPVIKPLKKIIPSIGKLETATLVFILVLELIKYLMIMLLSFHMSNPFGIILIAIGDALRLLFQTLSMAIIFQVILSWVQPYSPLCRTLNQVTSPLMRPIQKVIPSIGGIDISPIPAILLLQLLTILLVEPIKAAGLGIALGA